MLSDHFEGASQVGGVRGYTPPTTYGQPGQIQIGKPGTYCFEPDQILKITREDTSGPDVVFLHNLPAGQHGHAAFADQETSVSWPAEMLIHPDGQQFFLQLKSSPLSGTRIGLTPIGLGKSNDLAALIHAGCDFQAEGVLASLIDETP